MMPNRLRSGIASLHALSTLALLLGLLLGCALPSLTGAESTSKSLSRKLTHSHEFRAASRHLSQFQDQDDYEDELEQEEEGVGDFDLDSLEKSERKGEQKEENQLGVESYEDYENEVRALEKDDLSGLEGDTSTAAKYKTVGDDDNEESANIDALEADETNPEVLFDSDTEKAFEDMIKSEAHQKALESGTNPAMLAAGKRNSTQQNSTRTSSSTPVLKDATSSAIKSGSRSSSDAMEEEELSEAELEELEELEAELGEGGKVGAENEDPSTLTLPVDESIQQAIDAHLVDPMPAKKTSQSNKTTVANDHEKGTLTTLKDLQGVVNEEDLEDSLALEKEAETERLEDNLLSKNASSTGVDKSTQTLESFEARDDTSQSRNATVLTQGMIMGGAIKDAVSSQSSTALRVIAIIVAAVAGIGAAWGSILIWKRFHPGKPGPSLPKVIEIGGFTRKSPTYSRVKVRSDDNPSSNQWQDWDENWDEEGSSSARRGNSVKQKRAQKWDEDW